MTRYFWLTGLLGALAGCGSPTPPENLTCPALAVHGPEIIAQGNVMTPEEAAIFGMGAMFEERIEAAQPRTATRRPKIKVVALSAGGQWGAFTAGFMTGWSKNPYSPRPDAFDIVTGVSTGAILAPAIFAGPDYDGVLEASYNGLSEPETLRRRGPLELISSPSLFDIAPTEARIDRFLDAGLVGEIGEAAKTRSLVVGAVNLRSGFFEPLDQTAMAASDADNKPPCLREAILASAAIPLAFAPRRINGSYYVDGGARQGLFLQGLAATKAEPEIFIFLNGSGAFPEEEPEYSLGGVAARASAVATDELLRQAAIDAIEFARKRGWKVRGLFAPDILPGPDCFNRKGGKISFCESFTRQLFAAGKATGEQRRIPWLNADQLLDRLKSQIAAGQ